jgi:hypothetical protein
MRVSLNCACGTADRNVCATPKTARAPGRARKAQSSSNSLPRLGLVLLLLAARPLPAWCQLEILPAAVPQQVFSGPVRKLKIEFRNPTDKTVEITLSTRIYQAASATIMPMGEVQPWKTLAMLPRQTILENISLDFPDVRIATRFQVHWLDEKKTVTGWTEVIVYPDNLLKKLSTLAEEKPLGLLDPDKQIGPLLTREKVEFKVLENSLGVEEFQGRLVIVGPFSSALLVRRDFPELTKRVAAKARASGAIVWLQPPSGKLEPSLPLYTVPAGAGTVVVAPPSTVADFAESPASQLNLIHFVELALQSDSLRLPKTEP